MKPEMHEATVCAGSNIPQCHHELQHALQWIGSLLGNLRFTTPYLTAPEGCGCGTEPYLNAVCRGFTTLSAEALKERLKAYERMRGRLPEHKQEGKIIIDIDLVIFDGITVNEKEFTSSYFRTGYESLK